MTRSPNPAPARHQDMEIARASKPSRRTLAKSAVWAVPAAVATTAAPAYAGSKDPNYSLNASWFSTYQNTGVSCNSSGGFRLRTAGFTNNWSHTEDDGKQSAPGFAGLNQPAADGSQSPSTTMTLQSYKITIYYPTGMIHTDKNGQDADISGNTRTWSNGFGYNPTAGTQNYWTGPVVSPGSLTNNGVTYDGFAFTWKGNPQSASTVNAGTASTPSWPNSNTLVGAWWVNTDYCISPNPQYAVKLDYSFTTANGVSGGSKSGGDLFWTTMVLNSN